MVHRIYVYQGQHEDRRGIGVVGLVRMRGCLLDDLQREERISLACVLAVMMDSQRAFYLTEV